MITKEQISSLLKSTETYRIEKTISTNNMDKFCEAICAFANDLPDSRKKRLYAPRLPVKHANTTLSI